jgi:hypothetical protein
MSIELGGVYDRSQRLTHICQIVDTSKLLNHIDAILKDSVLLPSAAQSIRLHQDCVV